MGDRPVLPESIQKLKHQRAMYQKLIDEYAKRRIDLKQEMVDLFIDDNAEKKNCQICTVIHCPIRNYAYCGSFKCKYMVKDKRYLD